LFIHRGNEVAIIIILLWVFGHHIPWSYKRHPPIIGGMPRARDKLKQNPFLGEFGKAVRSIRLESGFSQEALADLADLDRSYMGGVERGEHNIALINIKKVASALGVSVAELMARAKL
jgi:ribosome-binding protein aMBF1 (putative translation factor)